MKDGFKIADVDTHLMEPDYVFERYIDDRYKSAAPKMGVAPESGRRTFLVEGEPFTREKGKYPMAAPGFLDAVRKAMKRFERAAKLGFSPESRIMDMDEQGVDVQIVYPTAAGQMLGREFRDPQLLAACCRAYNDWSADYCSKTRDRVKWAAILPMQDVGESIKEANRAAKNGAISFYVRPNPVRGRTIFHDDYLPLWAEVEKLGPPDFHPRFRLRVGRVVRRSDGHSRHRPYPVASVRGDGCDGGSHLVRRHRKIPQAPRRPGRSRRRMGSVLATADGTALGFQRQLGARVFEQTPD